MKCFSWCCTYCILDIRAYLFAGGSAIPDRSGIPLKCKLSFHVTLFHRQKGKKRMVSNSNFVSHFLLFLHMNFLFLGLSLLCTTFERKEDHIQLLKQWEMYQLPNSFTSSKTRSRQLALSRCFQILSPTGTALYTNEERDTNCLIQPFVKEPSITSQCRAVAYFSLNSLIIGVLSTLLVCTRKAFHSKKIKLDK